jgi:hypothetical protein
MQKRIRQWMYRDIYFANVSEPLLERHRLHTGELRCERVDFSPLDLTQTLEHCLEHLRELVMCRGDVALTTFFYRGDEIAAKLLAEHECVNWASLENWSKQRSVDLTVPGTVRDKVGL